MIPAVERERQVDLCDLENFIYALQCESQDSRDYAEKLYLEKTTKRRLYYLWYKKGFFDVWDLFWFP